MVIFEPDSSPVISTGQPGVNSIEGIGIGMVPPLLDLDRFDEIRAISEDGAFAMARRLAAEEGLLLARQPDSMLSARSNSREEIGEGKTVVTLACDTGLKYLSGDLYRR